MGEIREGQITKLFFKTVIGSEQELDCSIKKVYKDRISLNFPKEIIDYVDYLEEGDEVHVKIFTHSGIKAFDAIIINSPLESDFVIEFVENYIEIQRRKYLRSDLNTKVIIQRGERGNIITHTFDIGGGGIRFYYEGSFALRETIECMLYLPMHLHSIHAKGFIIKDEHLEKNEHVMVFTKIEERERDKIIKKCFEIESANSREIEKSE